jgi:predicted ATPase
LKACLALFATWPERKPLMLALEDAHWADEHLLLLRHLARRARATTAPDDPPDLPARRVEGTTPA